MHSHLSTFEITSETLDAQNICKMTDNELSILQFKQCQTFSLYQRNEMRANKKMKVNLQNVSTHSTIIILIQTYWVPNKHETGGSFNMQLSLLFSMEIDTTNVNEHI